MADDLVMTEFDELIRRDVDVTSPAPRSRYADRPFLIGLAGVAGLLATAGASALAASEGGPIGLGMVVFGGCLIWAGALIRRDYEDSINWLISWNRNPPLWRSHRGAMGPTHEDRRAHVRAQAAAAIVFGALFLLIGLPIGLSWVLG